MTKKREKIIHMENRTEGEKMTTQGRKVQNETEYKH